MMLVVYLFIYFFFLKGGGVADFKEQSREKETKVKCEREAACVAIIRSCLSPPNGTVLV